MSDHSNDTVLAIVAHPDDEVLGCGGTLARYADEGYQVYVLFASEGFTAKQESRQEERCSGELEHLKECARSAANILGCMPPHFLDLPDNRMDRIELLDIIKNIEAITRKLRPSIVLTHFGGDLNIDHRLVHQAAITACRPLPEHSVKAIYTFETVSSTEWGATTTETAFRPQRYIDITSQFDRKMLALKTYECEMRPFPHPRSFENIKALAMNRGSSVGREFAEAFMVVREIVS